MPHWQAQVLAGAVLGFIGITAWWWSQNTTMLDWDSGIHMNLAFFDATALREHAFTEPFGIYTTYPPLVHLVGAIAILAFGMHPMAVAVVHNVVFVPLLAFGCYGVGSELGGRQAGLLAGLFAICTPMFTSMMHAYDIDPAQTAMVAASVWALLASKRFERVGTAALAGVLCGLALLTKETSILFLVGIVVSVVCRGGHRQRSGLAAFLGCALIVAGPWYLYHLHQLLTTFTTIAQLRPNPAQAPPIVSGANLSWYFWDLVNQQAGGPLALAFLAGFVIAVARATKDRQSPIRDLLAGAVSSYVLISCLNHKDPRYSLPALVYVAVLGTFWVPRIERRALRWFLTVGVSGVALLSSVGMSFGLGGAGTRLMVSLPGAAATMIDPGSFTLYENQGWLRGAPTQDGNALALLRAMRQEGVRSLAVDPNVDQLDYSASGLLPLADAAGLRLVFPPRSGTFQRYMLIRRTHQGEPAPCQVVEGDRYAVYVLSPLVAGIASAPRDGAPGQSSRYALACPGRPIRAWPGS